MKQVQVNGRTFEVPKYIQRIDIESSRTHGWQIRYLRPFKFFRDVDGDPCLSFDDAGQYLLDLVNKHPRQRKVSTKPLKHKRSVDHLNRQLPRGISGPVLVQRNDGGPPYAEFKVRVIRKDGTPSTRSIYIANENTWTAAKFKRALGRAKKVLENGRG